MNDHPGRQLGLSPQQTRLRPFLSALKPDKKTFPRLGRYTRAFFIDRCFDIACIALVIIIAGVVSLIPTYPPLLFPLLTPSGAVYNPSIAYPYRPAIFNSLTAGLICSLTPLGTILLAQIFIQSFADCSAAIFGLLYALATGTCFQIILKKTIGGLRPHFLAVCKPRPVPLGSGVGYNGIMYRVQDICTGNPREIEWGIQSFPSGHSEIAFAGLGYLALYLFTHLRIGDHTQSRKVSFSRMILVLMPILLATYICSTLVLTYQHHTSDCLFGAGIGCITALLGYRTAFRSVCDPRLHWKPRIGKRLKKAIEQEQEVTGNRDEMELEEPRGVSFNSVDGTRDIDSGRFFGWRNASCAGSISART